MQNSPVSGAPRSELNLWTIGSIAVVAYCLANVLHEGLGHGGACLLMGGQPKSLNAIFFEYDQNTVSAFGRRIIAAGGSVINLLTGGIAFAALRFGRPRADALRYFLWLFSSVSLLMAFGYLLFSGVLGLGDWSIVFDRLAPSTVVRGGLILVGGFLYCWAAPQLLIPGLKNFLDRSQPLEPQVRRLARLPYFVGGITFIVAGLLNPYGYQLVLMSAVAASFGATSLLAWCKVPEGDPAPSPRNEPVTLNRHPGWIVAAALTLVIFVGILGHGIFFRR